MGDRNGMEEDGLSKAALPIRGEADGHFSLSSLMTFLHDQVRSVPMYVGFFLGKADIHSTQGASVNGGESKQPKPVAAIEEGRPRRTAFSTQSRQYSHGIEFTPVLHVDDDAGENGPHPAETETYDAGLGDLMQLLRMHYTLASNEDDTTRVQQLLQQAQLELEEQAVPEAEPAKQASSPPCDTGRGMQEAFLDLEKRYVAGFWLSVDFFGSKGPRPSIAKSRRASTMWTTTTATVAAKAGWPEVIEVGYYIDSDGVRVDEIWRSPSKSHQGLPPLGGEFARWWSGAGAYLERPLGDVEAIAEIKVLPFDDLPLSTQQYIRGTPGQERFFVAGDLAYFIPSRVSCPHLHKLVEGARRMTPSMENSELSVNRKDGEANWRLDELFTLIRPEVHRPAAFERGFEMPGWKGSRQ
ncbi:hypothetical protein LTR36_000342 [Oleoguttula mirabilis]|uniref:Uncharacterized protein n=1 Tax=Oleoguttula mirabilis TaxID=1507867 RepID=A0AAV9JYV2_9PEZI|nr:hypothetical protein LTR36_000342 [Oleoguttula mirabilis]